MLDLIKVEPKMDLDIIRETLSRIGIGDMKRKVLYPSCYLMENKNKFYICHFKELFYLRDLDQCNMTEEDYCRRNSIAILLEDWGMIDIINLNEDIETIYVFCLSHKDKNDWQIFHKINIGDFQ